MGEPEFRRCDFCGCNTNARMRACCARGREADEGKALLRDSRVQDVQEGEAMSHTTLGDLESTLNGIGPDSYYTLTLKGKVWQAAVYSRDEKLLGANVGGSIQEAIDAALARVGKR